MTFLKYSLLLPSRDAFPSDITEHTFKYQSLNKGFDSYCGYYNELRSLNIGFDSYCGYYNELRSLKMHQ